MFYQYLLDQQVLSNEMSKVSTDVSLRIDEDEHLKAKNESGHITSQYTSTDRQNILTYTCVRPAHLSYYLL